MSQHSETQAGHAKICYLKSVDTLHFIEYLMLKLAQGHEIWLDMPLVITEEVHEKKFA